MIWTRDEPDEEFDSENTHNHTATRRQLWTRDEQDEEFDRHVEKIVEGKKDRILIMAGPGTGKSAILKRLIKNLLGGGQAPERILAVTFTRNADADFKKTLKNSNTPGSERICASTLHSYCYSFLEKNALKAGTLRQGVQASMHTLLDFETEVMVADLDELNPKFSKSECKNLIHKIEADIHLTDLYEKSFSSSLNEWLSFHKASHLNQLVPETLCHLKSSSSDIHTKFDYVIVDEYQDLNSAGRELVEMISKRSKLIVAGDANQLIYGFRYAKLDGIENFHKYGPPEKIFLDMCNRSKRNIVRVANNLIAKNAKSGQDCLPLCPNELGGTIHIIQWETQEQESKGVSRYVKHLLDSGECTEEEILILTPKKKYTRQICEDIDSKGIKIHNYGVELSDSEQKSFTLLTLLADCEDRVALRLWFELNKSTPRFQHYYKLRKYCESNNRSPKSVLDDMINNKLTLPDLAPLLEPYGDLVKKLTSLSKLNLHNLIDELLPNNNLDYTSLRRIAKDALTKDIGLKELYDEIKKEIKEPKILDDNFVKVMTLHKSKGLSSKVVIVTECVEGEIPYTANSIANESIEESRRLFYVALTRCTDTLILSYPATHTGMRRTKPPPEDNKARKSRFLDELGPAAPDPKSGIEWQASGYT